MVEDTAIQIFPELEIENYKEGTSKALVVEPNQVGPSGHVNFRSNC